VRAAAQVVAVPVAVELGVLDQDVPLPAEYAALVVVHMRVAHDEAGSVRADSGAVQVDHGGSGELDVLHGHIRGTGRLDPDSLAVAYRVH